MKIYDQISMCLRNLFRRKVRTSLTVIGVVVGTCAIVVMISIGIGMKASTDAMLAQMGDLTIIEINNYNNGSKDQAVLDDAAITEIQSIPGVQIATPVWQPNDFNIQFYSGKNDRYLMRNWNIMGMYPEAIPLLGYEFTDGAGITVNNDPKSIPIVLGQYAAYDFRDTKKKPGFDRVNPYPDAQGKIKDPFVDMKKDKVILRIEKQKDTAKNIEYKVTYSGTLKEDWGRGYETSRGIIMDIKDLKRLQQEFYKANGIKPSDTNKGYEQAKVKVADVKKVGKIETMIQDMGYQTYSMESVRKPIEDAARQQQVVLGGLGAISLFVAAIGITNTMVMSIYERTREIGVMKVLGCFVGNIRTIFLMEAGLIGFFGGIFGIILSFTLSFLINFFGLSFGGVGGGMGGMGMDSGAAGTAVSIIPLWLVVVGMIFATCVGLVAGFYPANRAVQISALEAIKHD